jgi:hypothetical protein
MLKYISDGKPEKEETNWETSPGWEDNVKMQHITL